jgi:hypothetical protein
LIYLGHWKLLEILPFNQRPLFPSWTNGIQWWFHPPIMFRMRILVLNGTLKRFHPPIKLNMSQMLVHVNDNNLHDQWIWKILLEILFDSNIQSWWMWFTFIKMMNNIQILNS